MSGPSERGSGMVFFGWVLIVGGGLMALLCGGCTAVFGGQAALDMINCHFHPPANESCDAATGVAPLIIMVALLIGGVPTLIGLVAVFIGFRMQRRPRRAAAPPPPPASDVWSP